MNESYTDGRTLYETVDNMGFDIDSRLAPYIKSNDDEALRDLFGREYNSLDDLVLGDSDPLKNGNLERKLVDEFNIEHFSNDYKTWLSNILKGKTKEGMAHIHECYKNVNLAFKAFLKAHQKGYIGDAHLVTLLVYQYDGRHFSAEKLRKKPQEFLKERKYFFVVYRDLLRRIAILNKNDKLRFPNLGGISGRDGTNFEGLYRGLNGDFYFDDFVTKGTYAESSSFDISISINFSRMGLGLTKLSDNIFMEISVPLDTQKILDLRFINPAEREILLTKGCSYRIDAILKIE